MKPLSVPFKMKWKKRKNRDRKEKDKINGKPK